MWNERVKGHTCLWCGWYGVFLIDWRGGHHQGHLARDYGVFWRINKGKLFCCFERSVNLSTCVHLCLLLCSSVCVRLCIFACYLTERRSRWTSSRRQRSKSGSGWIWQCGDSEARWRSGHSGSCRPALYWTPQSLPPSQWLDGPWTNRRRKRRSSHCGRTCCYCEPGGNRGER